MRSTASGLGVLIVLCSSTALANTVLVDCTGVGGYPTIQQGIAHASAGDTVLVLPGEYNAYDSATNYDPYWGRIYIGRSLTLKSQAGPTATVIVASSNLTTCVQVPQDPSSSFIVHIQGFRIVANPQTDGVSLGEGAAGSSVVDCVFESCMRALDVEGGGANGPASYSIHDCEFHENETGVMVGIAPQWNHVSVHDCYFDGGLGAVSGLFEEVHHNLIEGCYCGVGMLQGALHHNVIARCYYGLSFNPVYWVPDVGFASQNTIVRCWRGVTTSGARTAIAFGNNLISLCTVGIGDACFTGTYVTNDVWGNDTDYVTAIPGEDDFPDCDPLFCDAPAGDYSLRSDSPCVPAGVGALGIGCMPSASQAGSWGHIKSMYR